MGVDRSHQHVGGELGFRTEVDDLTDGMHAGIRAARGGYLDGGIDELRQRLLQVILHATARGLRLPAAERASVVLEAEGDAQG